MAEDTKYVGFWARAVATIIDNIWMSIVGLTIVLLAFGREAFIDSTEFSLSASAVLYLLPVVFVITFWRLKSATPGKMLFG
ncbi:RDD family protein, partial [Enterovibrio norvegicus]